MVREALAWWAEPILKQVAECKEKREKAEKEKQNVNKKINPDKVFSECLKQAKLESACSELQEVAKLSCLAGLALHFDAYGWKKDDLVKSYRNAIDQTPSTVAGLYEKAESSGAFPGFTAEQLALLPPGSFYIGFNFQLRKALHISKDDTDFYVIDNPVKKDWVFKVPYVAPSQWKGCLHAALARRLVDWWTGSEEQKDEFIRRRLQLVRLFGNEQGVEVDSSELETYLDRVGEAELAKRYRAELKKVAPEGRRRGRLAFYPTFFTGLGLAVINPHDRKTGAGTFPIYFETVPENTRGRCELLYVPFDRAGKDISETLREAQEDLRCVAEGVTFLLTRFGFGAKTASGFGLTDPGLPSEGEIAVRLAGMGKDAVKSGKFRLLDDQDAEGLVKKAVKLSEQLVQRGGNQ